MNMQSTATSQEATTLLAINSIFSFALALGGIFLQVFLFTLGGFHAVVAYNLVSACLVVIFYIVAGWLLRRVALKNLLLLGIGAHVLLFSLLLLFREQSLALIVPLGIINGMAIGLFWGAMTPLQYIFTTDEMRHRFFGKQSFLFSITGGIAPMLGGVLISLGGLLISKEFGYSFIFFLIALLMALLYREARKLPKQESIDFSFHDVAAHTRSRAWKLALVHDFCWGLFDFMFAAFTAVIMFLIVKEEFLLGFVNAAGAIIAACAGLCASIILARNRPPLVAVAFVAALGIGLFAWGHDWWGLVALTFLFNMTMPILSVASSKMLFDLLDRSKERWQRTYYLFLERELALGAGRVSSLLIFFLVMSDRNQFEIGRIAVGLLAIMPLCIGFILSRIIR